MNKQIKNQIEEWENLLLTDKVLRTLLSERLSDAHQVLQEMGFEKYYIERFVIDTGRFIVKVEDKVFLLSPFDDYTELDAISSIDLQSETYRLDKVFKEKELAHGY